jgi:ABC-type branched-subunit amino acid transport system ATPase component
VNPETLSCTGLYKSFDGVMALKDVSLSFRAGDVTALVGPNGAGKTTLLNVFSGFLLPDKGQCLFNSENIMCMRPHRIAELGIARTFQDVRLVRNLTALENVALAHPNQIGERLSRVILRVGLAKEEARIQKDALAILERVGLGGVTTRLAGELSYGQQKLLTLAVCLATRAHVILLDEPFSGVDPVTSTKLVELLNSLRQSQKILLFIEHDISAVLLVADRVVVMSEGTVLADGQPGQILARPDVLEKYLT